MHRSAPARLPKTRDTIVPFAAAPRLGVVKVVAAGASMGIDDAKGRGFQA
jgi:hypothetical protein